MACRFRDVCLFICFLQALALAGFRLAAVSEVALCS